MTKAASLSGKVDPVVRKITIEDVKAALAEGIDDFRRAPRHGLVLGAVSAVTGIAILALLYVLGLPYLAYPLGAGFALVCPFLAAGLYEVSRRLETGQSLAAGDVWATIKGRSEIRWMGFATVFILIMWMYQVRFLMALFLGYSGMMATLEEFLRVVFTTTEGLTFLAVGNIVGAFLATVLFSISVVSFPLVLDRDVDFVTAMITSIKAVAMNPVPMAFFAVIIAVMMFFSGITAFLGLLVALPVLGHTTWHLYRRVIAPAA
ncbi:MAG: hypothetical protein C0519_03340 [Hyphomicrobium sp.]|jgi:uncharacterized membrane protein|nr:hypothetical protein [Hyphomicrobium sp.]PPD09032.1 MAG: hypothetical protein CTY28_02970 [Hyphomicrobium sp.]